ncbi:hypothetical protein [Treponema sp.]|uniref:hypothetical protein n=1 Tax=Treponema sp. TaxID=166 RepID=UPI00388F9858
MINTYNETHLHRTLKEIYAGKHEGAQKEAPCGHFIADILLADGGIIEIQTGTLASLAPKIAYFLAEKRKIRVVHPLAVEKYVETTDENGKILRRKKSPKKLNLTSVFRELTKLYPYLLDRNFTLEIVEAKIIEERIDYGSTEKADNSRRRHKKTWNKTDKRLDELGKATVLHGKTAWKKLIPTALLKKDREFTAPEFHRELLELYPKAKRQETSVMLWVYVKMGFFERIGKKGNAFLYSPL